MVVVDTSIVYKWVQERDTRHLSLEILWRYLSDKEEILVPDILLYELANALSSKTELTIKDIQIAWNLFRDFNVPIFTPTNDFIRKCLNFSRKYKVTVYDASYAVLAEEKRCSLITADQKFVKQVNLPNVKYLGDY